MDRQNETSKKEYMFDPSSGTISVTQFVIEESNRLIAADTVTMLSCRLLPVRSEVIDSLDKSLKKHAGVWSELSKY